MTPEGKVKAMVKRVLTKYEPDVFWYMPVHTGYGTTGIPDVIACVNGRFLGIECKAGKGKLTQLQMVNKNLIEMAKGYYVVCRENSDVELEQIIRILKND